MYVTDLASAWRAWRMPKEITEPVGETQRDTFAASAEFRRLNRASITAFRQAINTFCEIELKSEK